MLDFAGYHPEDEDELFKYLKKSLRTVVQNHPGLVSDSLRRVVQPGWTPAPRPSANNQADTEPLRVGVKGEQ